MDNDIDNNSSDNSLDNSLEATFERGGTYRIRRPRSQELKEMSTQWRNSLIAVGRKEKNKMSPLHLVKRGLQVIHVVAALGFLVLAVVEFVMDPPYFDAVAAYAETGRHGNATKIPRDTFYNLTRSAGPGSVRHVMDLPVVFLFLCYFIVLLWRGAWGTWSFLMTFSMCLILFVFVLINYWAHDRFDWRYFSSRGFGVIIEVFCFALAWNCVAMATFMKINWFPFKFSKHAPSGLVSKIVLALWNFFAVLIFLFFCLLIWFSRLYYSWVCVESLNDVLLMCQFTNLVQCYACEEAATCTHLDTCVMTARAKRTFHCESPLAGLHDVNEAFCIFNYNIGFFTFIMVFAYVGGTYFFLSNVVNFAVRCIKVVMSNFVKVMSHKTRPHIERFTYSISKRRNTVKEREAEEEEEREEEGSGRIRQINNGTIRSIEETDVVHAAADETRDLLRHRWSNSDDEEAT